MRIKVFIFLVILFLFSISFAQTSMDTNSKDLLKASSVQKTSKKDLRYPVSIVYSGQDSIGMRLVLEMKEYLVSSKIFRLSTKDERKIKIYIKTREEFPSRPGLGSVYLIVWTYSASEDVLPTYLDSEVGTVSFNQIKAMAGSLLYKTDEMLSQYSYLFEK